MPFPGAESALRSVPRARVVGFPQARARLRRRGRFNEELWAGEGSAIRAGFLSKRCRKVHGLVPKRAITV